MGSCHEPKRHSSTLVELIDQRGTISTSTCSWNNGKEAIWCHEAVEVMEGFPEEVPNGVRAEGGGGRGNKAKKGENSIPGSRNSMCKGPVVRPKKASVAGA